ncbi:MAG: PH domain-containing protein [Ignavibacteria bacterium]|nr:PH domain-containing protein [Ignavibacteria bacterium]
MEYQEIQRAPHSLSKVLLWISSASTLFVALLFSIITLNTNEWEQALSVILSIVIVQLLIVPLYKATSLTVRIDASGVYVRLRPFHFNGRLIPWSEIQTVSIRKVRPIGEFGGWGIRWNLGKKTGYIWNGEQGLELFLTNGKIVVITIMDVEGARQAVNTYVTSGNIP